MKKVLVILLLFLPFFVKADLTKKQEENMTFFVTNFVSEGNKRLDKNGYSLLAYVDENNCIYGYQSKLFKLEYDYNKSHYIDSYKWTFDDSSFISFMYLKTFNLILTRSNTSKIDPYSGLNIKSETAKPYQLSDFLDDASKEEHFYIAYEEIDLKNEIESLKPGDLIIINEHIMLYLGDGMIAHASSDAISESK